MPEDGAIEASWIAMLYSPVLIFILQTAPLLASPIKIVSLLNAVKPFQKPDSGTFFKSDVTGEPLVKSTFQIPHDPGLLPPACAYCPATTAKTSGATSAMAAEHVVSVNVAILAAVFLAVSISHISPLSKKETSRLPFERAAMPSALFGEENL